MEKQEINKLGKKLELFTNIDYIGKGLPIILPRGAKLITLIRQYVETEEEKSGYKIVRTPNLSLAQIYKIEDKYEMNKKKMFVIDNNKEGEEKFDSNDLVLRPYTAPFHCSIYKENEHSYKELPIKYSETSFIYRNEIGDKLKQATTSDSSIFERPQNIEKTMYELIKFENEFIKKLDLEVKFYLQNWNDTRKEDYIGTINEWKSVTDSMKNAFKKLNIDYIETKEAKPYGPGIKIRYNGIKDFSNIQVDFEITHRFNLTYINQDNEEEFPFYIYRSSIGCYENLLDVLIDKYKGKFPLWMAPEQVSIIYEEEEYEEKALKIEKELKKYNIRVFVDNSHKNFQNKLANSIDKFIPYIVTIGKNQKIKIRYNGEERETNLTNLREEIVKNCKKNF